MKAANQFAVRRESSKAIPLYSKAIEAKPKDSKAYLKRAFQYSWLGKFEEATADYDKAIDLDPKNAQAYRERGCLMGRLKRFDDAIADFTKSIELNPKVPTPYIDRARCYQSLNKPEKARKDLDQAIKLQSGKEKVGIKNGSLYFTYGTNENNSKSGKKLGTLAKALVVQLRGNLSMSSGDMDEALADFNKSGTMMQKRPDRTLVAKSMGEKGKVETLIKGYSRLISMNSKDIDSYYNRAMVYLSLKRWSQATSDFSKVVELSSWKGKTAVQASIWRYVCLRKQNKDSEAAQVLKLAQSKCTDKTWPYALLGYLNGEKKFKDVLASTRGPEQQTQARCVAGFAEAFNGHGPESIKQFEWVEAQGDLSMDEFVIALNELPAR